MKNLSIGLSCLVMGWVSLSQPQIGWTKNIEIEIPVERAFAPAVGYDDNDNAQIILHGMLPNTCYHVGRYEVLKEGPFFYQIRQFAIKNDEGVCLQEDLLPPHMQLIVPFMTEVSLGQLLEGHYTFEYDRLQTDLKKGKISLQIKKAKAPGVDDQSYPNVSSISVTDIVDARKDVVVSLEGVLLSSCMTMEGSEVKIERVNNVFVVRPIVQIDFQRLCAQVLRSFKSEIHLGVLEEGYYLIHVRSRNGKAVNRVIESLVPIRQK